MKVLVLGGSGYIGSRLCTLLAQTDWAQPVCASARLHPTLPAVPKIQRLVLNTTDAKALAHAVSNADVVVNCVAGSYHAIAAGAGVLVQACLQADCRKIIHLSSMAVYGRQQALVTEQSVVDPTLGWYARAKCQAEQQIESFTRAGGSAVVFRPGCVWGAGSQLWVGRIGRWLQAHRLGDLGAAGDGWSNLVYVDDVCAAIIAALHNQPSAQLRVFNLAAPDSPRWNQYFVELAVAIGATPVQRIWPLLLRADAWVAGPFLKLTQSALARAAGTVSMPDPLSPGLVDLWARQLRLDSQLAEQALNIRWTSYAESLQQAVNWFVQAHCKNSPHRSLWPNKGAG